MGNPFYVPRRDSSDSLMKLARLGLQLYGLKQRGDIAKGQQTLTEKELGLRGEQINLERDRQKAEFGTPARLIPGPEGVQGPFIESATPGLRQQEINVHERQVGAQEEQNRITEAKLNPREKNWGLGDYTMFSSRLRQVGFDPDKLEFMKELKAVAMDNNVNRGAFAENLKVSWDQGGKNRFLEGLQKNIDDTLKKDPNANVNKQIQLIDAIQQTGADKVIPTFFPDIDQYDKSQAKKDMPTLEQMVVGEIQKGKLTPEGAVTLMHPPKETTASWHVVKDLKSPTGFSYENLNSPGALRPGAPQPSSVNEPSFKDKKLQEIWGRLDDTSKLKVLGALPADKELTEKNLLDVYGNIFTDAETKRSLQPIVESIIKKTTGKTASEGGGKSSKILPEGAKQVGTYNGKPVYQSPDGKRFVKE